MCFRRTGRRLRMLHSLAMRGDEGAGNIILRHRVFLVLPTGGKCMAMWCTIVRFINTLLNSEISLRKNRSSSSNLPLASTQPAPYLFRLTRGGSPRSECVVRLNEDFEPEAVLLVSI